jgi:micrococcal nuclease
VKIERKSLVFVLGGVLLLLVGFVLGQFSCNKLSVCLIPTLTPTPVPTFSPLPTATPTSSPVSEIFKVTRVIDGDTIEIETGERVRYLGIDAPETVDPRKPVQCFGIEASKKNKELVEGKTVRLEKDITDKDKYDRLLRYVYLDPSPPGGGSGQVLFVNLELVKQGFAFSYTYPPDVKYQKEILAAEQEAREQKRGLWAACPITPSPTIEIQKTPEGDCDIKGNISGSGEKIYHLPGCESYAQTQIDESRGERWFCSEEEAQASGWRKALNCP